MPPRAGRDTAVGRKWPLRPPATFNDSAVQRERLVQSDGAAAVSRSDLDAEIALFDAAVVRVRDPAAVG